MNFNEINVCNEINCKQQMEASAGSIECKPERSSNIVEEIMNILHEKYSGNLVAFKDPSISNQKNDKYLWNGKYWEKNNAFEYEVGQIFADFSVPEINRQQNLVKSFFAKPGMTINKLNINAATLLCTPKGVIDLQKRADLVQAKENPDTKENIELWLRPHIEYKDRYITVCTNAYYDPDYKTKIPKFTAFLKRALLPVEELSNWFPLFMGSILWAQNRGRRFYVFIGEPGSGKSTIVNLIRYILGTYAVPENESDIGIFSKTPNKANKTKMKAKRFLGYSETGKRKKLNTSTLKSVVGYSGKDIDNNDSAIGVTPVIDTNYILKSEDENDKAFLDRMILVPFGRTIPDNERIADLDIELRNETNSIFSLMVDMSSLYPTMPIDKPNFTRCAIEVYERAENPVKLFVEIIISKTEMDSEAVPVQEVFDLFNRFFDEKIENYLTIVGIPFLRKDSIINRPLSLTAFNKKMDALGLYTKRSGRGMNYIKIIIKHEVFSWDDKLEPIRRDPINSFQEKAIKDFKQAAEQRKTLRLPERDIQKRDDEIKKAWQEYWEACRNNQFYWQLVHNMAPMQMPVPYSMQPQNIPLPQKVVQPAKEATPPVEDYSYDYYAKDADGKVIWVNDSNNGNGVTPFDCKKGKYAPTTGSGIDPFGNKT